MYSLGVEDDELLMKLILSKHILKSEKEAEENNCKIYYLKDYVK